MSDKERDRQFGLVHRVSKVIDSVRKRGLGHEYHQEELERVSQELGDEVGPQEAEPVDDQADNSWRIRTQAKMGQAYRWGFQTPEGRKALAAAAALTAGAAVAAREIRKRRQKDE